LILSTTDIDERSVGARQTVRHHFIFEVDFVDVEVPRETIGLTDDADLLIGHVRGSALVGRIGDVERIEVRNLIALGILRIDRQVAADPLVDREERQRFFASRPENSPANASFG
jgi:hypothetical protein